MPLCMYIIAGDDDGQYHCVFLERILRSIFTGENSNTMAVRKKKAVSISHNDNMEQIKQELYTLLTGQDPHHKGDFDYWALIKRVTVLLIAVYGISRVGFLRKLAFSLVTSAVTAWMTESAIEADLMPAFLQSGKKG